MRLRPGSLPRIARSFSRTVSNCERSDRGETTSSSRCAGSTGARCARRSRSGGRAASRSTVSATICAASAWELDRAGLPHALGRSRGVGRVRRPIRSTCRPGSNRRDRADRTSGTSIFSAWCCANSRRPIHARQRPFGHQRSGNDRSDGMPLAGGGRAAPLPGRGRRTDCSPRSPTERNEPLRPEGRFTIGRRFERMNMDTGGFGGDDRRRYIVPALIVAAALVVLLLILGIGAIILLAGQRQQRRRRP